MMTVHQLRILWAVAHAGSLTKASKLLALAQPSLSQQLAKLETAVGTRLFDRNRGRLDLTDAGQFLLRKAEVILANVDEAEAGLKSFADSTRGVVAIGILNSAARILLPEALRRMLAEYPQVEIDVHEVAPAEAIDLLYGRQLDLAVLAANSVASVSLSFHQVELFADPQVLAVPRGLDLASVADVDRDLPEEERRVVNSCIQFNFGTQHTRRVEQWYRTVLPRHRLVGQCRTYEVALSLVQAGVGVALVPAISAMLSRERTFDVTLYRVPLPERPIVALLPSQNLRIGLYNRFVTILREVGQSLTWPAMEPPPPFMAADQEPIRKSDRNDRLDPTPLPLT